MLLKCDRIRRRNIILLILNWPLQSNIPFSSPEASRFHCLKSMSYWFAMLTPLNPLCLSFFTLPNFLCCSCEKTRLPLTSRSFLHNPNLFLKTQSISQHTQLSLSLSLSPSITKSTTLPSIHHSPFPSPFPLPFISLSNIHPNPTHPKPPNPQIGPRKFRIRRSTRPLPNPQPEVHPPIPRKRKRKLAIHLTSHSYYVRRPQNQMRRVDTEVGDVRRYATTSNHNMTPRIRSPQA